MKIKIEFEIEIEDGFWFDPSYPDEAEWFMGTLNSGGDTWATLYSNELGDAIGETNNFKYTILWNNNKMILSH